jgi:hypothetical protein
LISRSQLVLLPYGTEALTSEPSHAQFQALLASLDRGPEFQQAIMAAYRNAWPRNQPIFESLVADADTGVAQLPRSGQPK